MTSAENLSSGAADTVYLGGKIVTVDAAFSIAEAIAVREGRILHVGARSDVERLVGPQTRVVDLRGRTVLPGFIDTHAHVERAGLLKTLVKLDDVTSVAAALERVSAAVARTTPGRWIRGGAWHPVSQLAERRFLTRDELDSVAPDHPVALPIGHFTMCNSAALRLAKIDRTTPDPDGGCIHRDPATGEPNGTLEESAEDLVEAIQPAPTPAERVVQLRDAMAFFNALGITSAVSAAVDPATFRAHAELRRQGGATLRISAMFAPTGGLSPTLSLPEWEAFFSRIGAVSDFGDDWLTYSGIKMQIDGGMTLRTAAMRDGYPDDPAYKGTIVIEPERFDALVATCNRWGWRVGVHAVGDAAIDRVLDAYERADAEHSIRDRRFIVIHGSLIQPDQMRRAKKLGVRVDVQSCFLWDKAATVARYLGEATAARAFPLRTLIDEMGLDLLGQGTDYPINTADPFTNIFVATTRRDVEGTCWGAAEAITREEAIRLYTSAAARYAFMEDRTGSLEAGKLADMIVLSDDILAVPDEALRSIRVEETIVGGRSVYRREGVQ